MSQETINLGSMINKKIRISTPCNFIYYGLLTDYDEHGYFTLKQCEKYFGREGRFKTKKEYKSIRFKLHHDMKIELESSDEGSFDNSIKFGDCWCDVEGIPNDEPGAESLEVAIPEDSKKSRVVPPEEALINGNDNAQVSTSSRDYRPHTPPNLPNLQLIPILGEIPPPPPPSSSESRNLVPVILPTYCVVYVPSNNANQLQ